MEVKKFSGIQCTGQINSKRAGMITPTIRKDSQGIVQEVIPKIRILIMVELLPKIKATGTVFLVPGLIRVIVQAAEIGVIAGIRPTGEGQRIVEAKAAEI